jgi:hypothetical protein
VNYSLTGGIGAAGVAIPGPAASVLGAPAATSLLPPTIPAVGSVPGAPMLPVTIQSTIMSTPTEFLLLKNMFDPAVEVFIFYMCNFVFGVCDNFVWFIQYALASHLSILTHVIFIFRQILILIWISEMMSKMNAPSLVQ